MLSILSRICGLLIVMFKVIMKNVLLLIFMFCWQAASACMIPIEGVPEVVNEEITFSSVPDLKGLDSISKTLVRVKTPLENEGYGFSGFELKVGESLELVVIPLMFFVESEFAHAEFWVYKEAKVTLNIYYGGPGSCGPEKQIAIET